ncbi:MAG TPA: hypothetical protein VH761_03055, partial [Ilumatobacteraceae bacterium]
LDDDAGAFSDGPVPQQLEDPGGPRWIGPVALAALVCVIIYGVATSTSGGGAPEVVEPASSTTAVTSTTRPAPTTTAAPKPPVPYYSIDPPRGFRVQYVSREELHGSYGGGGMYQLWATDGATSTSGSWFAISYYNDGGIEGSVLLDGYRIESERGALSLAHVGSGQSVVQLASRNGILQITAFGVADDDLVRLAESIVIDTSSSTVSPGDEGLVAGFTLLSTVEPWRAYQGDPVEQLYYTTTGDPLANLSLTISPVPQADQERPLPDRRVASRFLLERATSFTVDGHEAIAGEVANSDGYAMASWVDGDYVITVGGTLSVPDLIQVARTVHTVSASDWRGMEFQAQVNSMEAGGQSTDYTESRRSTVADGAGTDGEAWTIEASIGTYGTIRSINWYWAGSGISSTPTDAAQITTAADDERSYVLADLPRAITTSAELRVTRAGLDAVVVPFADVDPELDRTFAAYAFSEPGPYSAEIVATDGTVLATWPLA